MPGCPRVPSIPRPVRARSPKVEEAFRRSARLPLYGRSRSVLRRYAGCDTARHHWRRDGPFHREGRHIPATGAAVGHLKRLREREESSPVNVRVERRDPIVHFEPLLSHEKSLCRMLMGSGSRPRTSAQYAQCGVLDLRLRKKLVFASRTNGLAERFRRGPPPERPKAHTKTSEGFAPAGVVLTPKPKGSI